MATVAGAKRAVAAGVAGHVPILILVDGKHAFTRKDGAPVELKSFPASSGLKGAWSIDDANAAISAAMAR